MSFLCPRRFAGTGEHTRGHPLSWVALKRVSDPARYGVAKRQGGRLVGNEEKPERLKGDHAVAGIYLYPPGVFEVIGRLRPNRRGAQEITDVNRHFLDQGRLG